MFPAWLTIVAATSLLVALGCAIVIVVDELRRPQRMWIMNLVWPLCALFGGVLWLVLYWEQGRAAKAGTSPGQEVDTPMWAAVAKGASHCGAGCTLGDIIAEWAAFLMPSLAVAFGWRSLFGERMVAVWLIDYVVAFALGIAFQFFTIKPMTKMGTAGALWQAIKADASSITAWQVGMYGLMAAGQWLWFAPVYGRPAPVNSPEFWFLMQIAMLAGFCTSYPVNWLLVRAGVKERM